MFKLQKNQKTVFSKLYRYYCAKLLSKIWLVLLYFLLFIFIIIMQSFTLKRVLDQKLLDNASWQWRLLVFWSISLFQLFALWTMMHPLVSYLVGRGLGWEELKKKQLFRMPKISREEDTKVLIFTPNADRETIIRAKFAAAFAYFMVLNFLLLLPLFIFFLFFTKFGVISSLAFLLFNGIGFALINFLLLVPFLFYQAEMGSILVALLYSSLYMIIFVLPVVFFREFVRQYPLVFGLLEIPFSALVGYIFFSLYRKKFLKNDLD